jgi:replicative DNA helicase
MPQVDLEKSILSAFVCDADATHYIGKLEKMYFSDDLNKSLFVVIKNLYDNHEAIDLVTIAEIAPELQGYAYNLFDAFMSSVHIRDHIRLLKRRFIIENLIKAAGEFTKEITDTKEINKSIKNFMTKISKEELEDTIMSSRQIMQQFMNDFNRKPEEREIFKTGFEDLDKKLQINPGMIVFIAGRTSKGKTALVMNMAGNLASTKKKVLVFSLEMPGMQLGKRQVSKYSRVNLNKVKNPERMSNSESANILKQVENISALSIMYESRMNVDIEEMKMQCRRLHAQNKIDIVIIDYLQLIRGGKFYRNANERLTDICRDLKLLAGELQIPFIVLSQLNRKSEERKKPQLSDLKDSGAIEETGDAVLMIYQPDEFEAQRDKNMIKILIAKNRNGETGDIKLYFYKQYQEFTESKYEDDSQRSIYDTV